MAKSAFKRDSDEPRPYRPRALARKNHRSSCFCSSSVSFPFLFCAAAAINTIKNGDDSKDSSSIPARVRRKLIAKRKPSCASFHDFWSLSIGIDPIERNLHWLVASTAIERTSVPWSSVNQFSSHSSWKSWSSSSNVVQRDDICAIARSLDLSFAPRELTRTKISVTSS